MNDFLSYSFWLSIAVVFYSYLGYGLVLFFLVLIKRLFTKQKNNTISNPFPTVTLLVAAYNEADFINEKIKNSLALNYPKNRIKYFFVTDGSNDATPEIVSNCPEIIHLHEKIRKGKIAAVERAMEFIDTDIVVYTDANTFLNKNAIVNIVRHYADKKVGAVAGEKRIATKEKDNASGAGEGIYWKYESTLKRWDSELNSVVGAAGELFSIRTILYEPVPADTIIEDFYMTLRIAKNGYRVIYEPEAYAQEGPSASVSEELKRKIRIAAGGIQSIIRLKTLLNPFKYGILSFQYISHRVLRWTITPLLLPLIFIINFFLALKGITFYQLLLVMQFIFYICAGVGYILAKKDIKNKLLFIPFYFCMMNYAVYRGIARYFNKSQSVIWEKAKRAEKFIEIK